MHVQVRRGFWRQISCSESPLAISVWISRWNQQGAPWAIAEVKILTTFLLMPKSPSLGGCISVVRVFVIGISSQTPVTTSVWISREINGEYLDSELWKQSKFRPCFLRLGNLYHLVHVQVRRQSQVQISCLESPLQLFQYEYYMKSRMHTLSYGSSEEIDGNSFDGGIFIT